MENGTGRERTERIKRNNLRLVSLLSSVFVLGILMYGIGHDTALAYPASVCAQCHADGRSGTPPATPTHIQMGLVTAPAAPATPAGTATPAPAPQPSIAPAAPAPAPAPTPTSTAGTATGAAAGTPSSAAPAAKTPASANGSVCARCHQDGRTGLTPPGHPAISGILGNGAAPPPKAASGKKTVKGASGSKVSKPGSEKKASEGNCTKTSGGGEGGGRAGGFDD